VEGILVRGQCDQEASSSTHVGHLDTAVLIRLELGGCRCRSLDEVNVLLELSTELFLGSHLESQWLSSGMLDENTLSKLELCI
jgi:hypothetical protein